MDRKALNPVSLSSDADLRRLGEQVRGLLAGNAALQRLTPGSVLHGQPTGAPFPVAQWGAMNRLTVPTGAAGVVGLPRIRSDRVGYPLTITLDGGVPVQVLPLGVGLSGRRPTLNGNPGARFFSPGPHTFVNDGQDWYGADERQVFDVSWFGASPYATPAANTAAFQKAVNAAHRAGGGIVVIPPGRYILASIGGNVAISLTGLRNVCIRGSGAYVTTLQMGDDQDAHIFNINGATNIEVYAFIELFRNLPRHTIQTFRYVRKRHQSYPHQLLLQVAGQARLRR
jgi:hypothetical protein